MNKPDRRTDDDRTDASDESDRGQVSEVSGMDPGDAETPIAPGDATAGYPESESGGAQEPEPEAGPNANPHRDQETR